MQREELYHRTVDILYQAYFNDTLEHGNTCGCAVGNIVAARCGYIFIKSDFGAYWVNQDRPTSSIGWSSVFITNTPFSPQSICAANYQNSAKAQIDATGYKWRELAKIEYAFEKARNIYLSEQENMFNGLVAVLDVLKDIHGVTDEDLLQANKSRFEKHYQTLTA